jgi:lipopolysaccharide heptosyltransferase I
MAVVPYPDLSLVKRVLIIRLSSIGDVTHALPVAAALKDSFPHLELTWIVEEMSAEIVTGSPCVNSVIVIPRNRWKRQGRLTSPTVWREYYDLLSSVHKGRFDVALDLQGYGKSALLALASGARYRFGWHRMRDGSGLVSRPLPTRPGSLHRVDKFLDVPAALGVAQHPVRFPLYIPGEAVSKIASLLAEKGIQKGSRYAVINPAVGSPNRKWSSENYGKLATGLAEQFGLSIVLIGSGKDKDVCLQVCEEARQSNTVISAEYPIVDLSGETSLKELAAVLDSCAVHVCGDTGSAHIAAALGRQVVALYGPTDPGYAGPWNQSDNVLAHREYCIEGCGVRRCAVTVSPIVGDLISGNQAHVARCLSEITPQEVLNKVREVIDVQT